jgi:hypothetical protein
VGKILEWLRFVFTLCLSLFFKYRAILSFPILHASKTLEIHSSNCEAHEPHCISQRECCARSTTPSKVNLVPYNSLCVQLRMEAISQGGQEQGDIGRGGAGQARV